MPKKKPTVYLAYGSNLNLRQMSHRCPTATPIGTTELRGYELKFRGSDGSAVATVEPGDGTVPALLWKLKPQDERALDHYEGFPHLYRKEFVEVEIGGKHVDVMVYIMNDGHELGRPSVGYLNIIREGYDDSDLDVTVLDCAVSQSLSERARVRQQLEAKLHENLQKFNDEWMGMRKVDIIESAAEIAATQQVHKELLHGSYNTQDLSYLLRFENPLEVVRDQWMSESYFDISDDMEHALWDLADRHDTECDYALDPEFTDECGPWQMEMEQQ